MSTLYSLIEQIEADIRRRSFHPFYENITFIYIKIICEILVLYRWGFPIKLLRNFTPEFHWILYRSRKKTNLSQSELFVSLEAIHTIGRLTLRSRSDHGPIKYFSIFINVDS